MNRHTKLPKENMASSSSLTRPITDMNARAIIESNMKNISQLNRACADLTLDSKEEATNTESDDEKFYKTIGRNNAYVSIESSKDFSESDADNDTSSNDDTSDDEPVVFCLVAKSSHNQVSTKHKDL